jgi:glycine/D-amino acid oxidase-like deaminating enzyme
MLPHTLVSGIVLHGDAVAAVETEHGTIRCETIVDAAGAWLRAVAALAGARSRWCRPATS